MIQAIPSIRTVFIAGDAPKSVDAAAWNLAIVHLLADGLIQHSHAVGVTDVRFRQYKFIDCELAFFLSVLGVGKGVVNLQRILLLEPSFSPFSGLEKVL